MWRSQVGGSSQKISHRLVTGLSIAYLINGYTLWLFNIAMENGPFIDEFPIKNSIYKGFSMAMLNNQMVNGIVPTLGK